MSFPTLEGGGGLPPAPDWTKIYDDPLDIQLAAEEWGTVTREMQASGILVVANGNAIRRLVDFRIQYARASEHVAENGPILKGKRAKVGQWNPWWSVMKAASEELRNLEASLGISPTSRGKASKVNRAKKKPKPSDEFLGPAGG